MKLGGSFVRDMREGIAEGMVVGRVVAIVMVCMMGGIAVMRHCARNSIGSSSYLVERPPKSLFEVEDVETNTKCDSLPLPAK